MPAYAVDVSVVARCDASASPGRGYYYHASRHSAGQPIVAGWAYSWVAQLGAERSSWTAPLDAARLAPGERPEAVAVRQVRALAPLLPPEPVPLFVFDAGFNPAALTAALADAPVAVLVRFRDDRVFFRAAAARRPRSAAAPRHAVPLRRRGHVPRPATIARRGRGMTLLAAALAGSGAAILAAVLSLHYLLLAGGAGRGDPTTGAGAVGLVCGLAAGVAAGAAYPPRAAASAVGGWLVWAAVLALANAFVPAGAYPVAVSVGLAAALLASWLATRGATHRPREQPPRTVLVGALGGFALLALGVAALGGLATAGLRPGGVTAEYYANVYLRWMGAALWAVVFVGAAFALGRPLIVARGRPNRLAAAVLSLGIFVLLGAAAAGVLDFYVACMVGTPLPPLKWLTGGASC